MAWDFDGVNDGLEYSLTLSNYNSTGITISAWQNWDGFSGGDNDRIIDFASSGSFVGDLQHNLAEDVLQFVFAFSTTSLQQKSSTTASTGLTGTHHLAATHDGSTTAANAKVYIDGSDDSNNATEVNGSGTHPGATDLAVLGKRRNAAGGNIEFDGRLWDVAVWSAELTAAEVSALSNGASPLLIRPDKIDAYFPLGGSTLERLTGTLPTEYGDPAKADTPRPGAIIGGGGLQNVGGFSARRRAIIDKLIGDQSGGSHWDEVKANIPASALVRTSATVATLDLTEVANAGYDNTANEVISLRNLDRNMWKVTQ